MTIVVETAVKAVTVYPDRARVTVSGGCDLDAGVHRLVVRELPPTLVPASVRASGHGEAAVQLRSVDIRTRHYESAPSPKVDELESEIEAARGELSVLDDRQAAAHAQLEYLNGMRGETEAFAKGLAKGKTSVEEQATLLTFLREQDLSLREMLREIEAEAKQVRRRLARLEAELDELKSEQPRERYEVIVEVEASESGAFELHLSYVVTSANWQPLYDIRLRDPLGDNTTTTLDITALAEVSQNTGQDWLRIELTLSTARPAVNQRVPELNPWYINARMPRPAPMAKEMFIGDSAEGQIRAALPYSYPASARAANVREALVENTGAVVSFVVPGGTDIPGDGSPHKTTVNRFELAPELDYLAVPKHTTAVFRRVRVENNTPAPWLSGPVNLFAGEEYIGSHQMIYTAVGGELELVLGVEERVEIERELVQRDVDKRLLRDVRQTQFTYETRLKNLLPSKIKVTVKDNFPVSQHEQLKVRLDSVQPQPTEQSEMHMLEWELTLSPQAKATISLQYSVEHPRDMSVIGLVD